MAYSVSALETLNPAMKTTRISKSVLILCCCAVLTATACGQRGPLYIVKPEEAVGNTVQSEETTAEETDEDAKKETADDPEIGVEESI